MQVSPAMQKIAKVEILAVKKGATMIYLASNGKHLMMSGYLEWVQIELLMDSEGSRKLTVRKPWNYIRIGIMEM